MKKIILLFLLFSINAFSQKSLVLMQSNESSVVTEVEGKTAKELFEKTKEWVNVYYKDPKEVLKAEIQNEMIRIQGFGKGFFYQKSIFTNYIDVLYTIEFNFKDGKYRVLFYSDKFTQGGQNNLYLSSPKDFFNKEGMIKSNYKASVESFVISMNEIYLSHYNYITGGNAVKNKDW